MAEDFKPHLFVQNIHTAQKYKVPPRNIQARNAIPERDRVQHGNSVLNQLKEVWNKANQESILRKAQNLPTKDGEYVTFKSAKENKLKIESLDANGARLLNVKFDETSFEELATLFIPDEKKEQLISKIEKYADIQKVERFNKELVARIEQILSAGIENLWSSAIEYLPKEEAIWIELWLSGGKQLYEEVQAEFQDVCELFNIQIGEGLLVFPERTVINIKADYEQLGELVKSFGHIAELRKPEELNSFWLDRTVIEREDWINETLDNITFNKTDNFISVLDTGINNAHLLIAPVLDDENKLTADINWGTNDKGGHGTKMAGVAVYGNLNSVFENPAIEINHQLESVKIIAPNGEAEEEKLPFVTQNAINLAIINNADIKRIYCFANTGRNQFEFGRPSTWSATIDNLIFGDDHEDKKVFVISAGNIREEDDYSQYPENNLNLQIESPAQSWNALSVGAFTQKILPNRNTVAGNDELSPFSRTSNAWESNWPIKPDIVFEGGNLIKLDNGDIDFHDDLDVLTTSSNAVINQLTTINATSAATAFASNFIARLRHAYPNAWEETLRGLVVHSASWTPAMKEQFDFDGSQASIVKMLRTYGYGVPNLEKAIECQSNYLTFISEEIIQPYIKEEGKNPATNDVHFYEFPWPKDTLEGLGDVDVTVRITLSYFIEPNPGEKGYSTKYSYQSTALKFAMMPPNDSPENFMLRINNAAREDLKEELEVERLPEDAIERMSNVKWALGAENVFKGSVHSNFWKTSAANAAACNYIAVYPQPSGWWKNLKKKHKYNEKLRYSLIVSIETPENVADIYTMIAQKVNVENLIKV
ncbi:S8 family peptidase [Maribacter sp. ACAM166]|uniref:S8 family peptidase n=1 Tax=Maribacter sp. ACAM166 TaxID=2508996 RepID=UPI0010FF5E6E|nr:S8 family peptidase [Maribacter sp. ACAM166]TLP81781.1 S8 family peptidase [Maribacter sp. ACAM166]